jgi:hypothetical protein
MVEPDVCCGVSIERVYQVTQQGHRRRWTIPSKLITMVGDSAYVKLPRAEAAKSPFTQLVMETNLKKDPKCKRYSMTQPIGLTQLIELRNDAQAMHMRNKDIPEHMRDTLIDADPTPKKRRVTRDELKHQRDTLEEMVIRVPQVTCVNPSFLLKVLRPTSPRDVLAVKLDASTIGEVIEFLRHTGFTDDVPAVSRVHRSKGIWRRKKRNGVGFVYCTKDKKGRTHRCDDVFDAERVRDAESEQLTQPDDTTAGDVTKAEKPRASEHNKAETPKVVVQKRLSDMFRKM